MLFHGRWDAPEGPEAVMDGHSLLGIELNFRPEEPTTDQPFEMVGSVSSIISRRFDDLTTQNGKVVRLKPTVTPDALGLRIPEDYSGDALKLWQFSILPNDDIDD